MNRTTIDWPELAYTWNPIVGCANGCAYCYAKRLNDRFKWIDKWYEPVLFHERLDEPIRIKKPSTIFVGSMCDIFSKGVLNTHIHQALDIVKKCPKHTFMFLTKRPERYRQFEWPENTILGATLDHKRHSLRLLYQYEVPGRKFLSIEPMLSDMPFDLSAFEFVIVGADSTKGAKIPEKEWITEMIGMNPDVNFWFKGNILKHYPELKLFNDTFIHENTHPLSAH